ncbi:hypothetical protein E8E11_000244 [Didymella keratinophila]|nr:hypothetical protein E8E11_000244 [Didymella keratinophila]
MANKRSAADILSEASDDEDLQHFLETYKRLKGSTKAANTKDEEIMQLRTALQQAQRNEKNLAKGSLAHYKSRMGRYPTWWLNAVGREEQLKSENAQLRTKIETLEAEKRCREIESVNLQVLQVKITTLENENSKLHAYKRRLQRAAKQD